MTFPDRMYDYEKLQSYLQAETDVGSDATKPIFTLHFDFTTDGRNNTLILNGLNLSLMIEEMYLKYMNRVRKWTKIFDKLARRYHYKHKGLGLVCDTLMEIRKKFGLAAAESLKKGCQQSGGKGS